MLHTSVIATPHGQLRVKIILNLYGAFPHYRPSLIDDTSIFAHNFVNIMNLIVHESLSLFGDMKVINIV